MDEDELYADFGSPIGGKAALGRVAEDSSKNQGSAAIELPLVKVDAGASLDVDVYDDLCSGEGLGETLLRTQLAELQARVRAHEAAAAELRQRVGDLTQQRDDAEARASVLATNISSLYTTAKLEIARKDDEIKELRGRLAPARSGSAAAAAMAAQRQQPAPEPRQPHPQQQQQQQQQSSRPPDERGSRQQEPVRHSQQHELRYDRDRDRDRDRHHRDGGSHHREEEDSRRRDDPPRQRESERARR